MKQGKKNPKKKQKHFACLLYWIPKNNVGCKGWTLEGNIKMKLQNYKITEVYNINIFYVYQDRVLCSLLEVFPLISYKCI